MKTIRINKGISFSLAGKPTQSISAGPVIDSVAWQAPQGHALQADSLVREGQQVARGELLFIDRQQPRVAHAAPASGTITQVVRGPDRALSAIEIKRNDEPAIEFSLPEKPYSFREIRDLLQQTGLWTQIRERPFDITPVPDSTPSAIFITAMDTRPLALEPAIVVSARFTEFVQGIEALLTQTTGQIYVAQASESAISPVELERVEQVVFAGMHPAGLAGTHIKLLNPVNRKRRVWQIDCQDVIAIGALLQSGVLDVERVVSLAGPMVLEPRLIRTQTGASIDELTQSQLRLEKSAVHVIAGSVFAGRQGQWLNRFDTQVTVLAARPRRAVLPSGPSSRTDLDTQPITRGFVAEPRFEQVSPLCKLPVPFLRALLVGDVEIAEALGCLEFAGEDLEPHAYVCPAGNDYPAALKRCHESLRQAT